MRKRFAQGALLAALVLTTACSDPKDAAREHVARGDRYLEQEKPAEAILQYRSAVSKDPESGEARQKLGVAQAKAGNTKAALAQLVRAADLMPSNVEAQVQAASILFRTGQFEDAEARADRALAIDPKNIAAHILKAQALAGLKDLDGAVSQLEEALALDPGSDASYTNLGAVEAMRGRHQQAEAALLKAIEIAPGNIEPRLAIANYYWAAARRTDAQEALAEALRIDPKHVAANRAMAMLKLVNGKPVEAEPFLKAVVDNSEDIGPRLTLADYYVAQKRAPEATPILEELAKRPGAFAAATARLAGIADAQGDRQKAHQVLDSVLAKEPGNVQVLYAKGMLLVSDSRLEDARKVAETAIKSAPESVQAHYLAGTVFTRQGKIEEAVASFQEVLKRNPKALGAQLQLARLHEAKGSPQVARQHAQDAVKLAPMSGPARYALVRSLIATGDLAGADRELATLAPRDSYEVQLSRARIAIGRRDFAAAQIAIDQAVSKQPTSLEALSVLASLEARNKRLPRAQAAVRTALATRPTDPGLLVLSARLDAATGQAATAEQTLRSVIDNSPDYLPAYEVLGSLYVRQKNLDAALREYERLAERRPTAIGPRTMVAMLHHSQGRQQEARAVYQKILEIDARAVVANNNLAYLYADEGKDLDMALQMAQAAKAASPDDPDVNDTLGWVYYKKDMAVQAIGPLLQSTRINPEKPIYHYHLGLAYAKAGERANARASLERALALGNFPEADAARRALEAVR
jgi:tetratricopeptide (TPR) repeat protein